MCVWAGGGGGGQSLSVTVDVFFLYAKAVLFRSCVLHPLNAWPWTLGVLTKPGPANMAPTV